MTKADRIRQLAKHEIFTVDEIVAIIVKEFGACHSNYARVVMYQRMDGECAAAKRYRERNREKCIASNKRWLKENAEYRRAYNRARYHAKREAAHA